MHIEEILNEISEREGIRFSYGQIKDLKKKKSVYFTNGKLKFILTKLFDKTKIRYMSYSDHIILTETEEIPQKKIIIGYVIEKENSEPIPYATVMLLKTGEGIISDYRGRFEFEFDKHRSDTIKINALGYKSKKIATDKLRGRNSIKVALKKQLIPIPEVDIKADDYAEVFVGNEGSTSAGALYLDTHGQEVALYVDNHNELVAKVEEIHFKLSPKGNIHAPFRIKIYEADTVGKPGKDILKDLLVVKPESKESWYKVNVSEFNIFMPKSGLFVSMGGVFPNDYNYYFKDSEDTENEKMSKIKDLSYGQRLCYNRNGKNNTWHYSLSHEWFQLEKKRFNVMIRLKLNYKK
jgi:hypothetical protein